MSKLKITNNSSKLILQHQYFRVLNRRLNSETLDDLSVTPVVSNIPNLNYVVNRRFCHLNILLMFVELTVNVVQFPNFDL